MGKILLTLSILFLTGCTADPETDLAKCQVQYPGVYMPACMSSFGYDFKYENSDQCPYTSNGVFSCYEKRGLYRSVKLLYVKKQ